MVERSADWIRQAKRDLESARAQKKDGFFEWACFISQQAAEKAIKAVYQKLGAEAWGHATSDLLRGFEGRIAFPVDLMDGARRLDRYYIPARYPNGWVSGVAGDYLTEEDAVSAISDSEKIVRFCADLLAGQGTA